MKIKVKEHTREIEAIFFCCSAISRRFCDGGIQAEVLKGDTNKTPTVTMEKIEATKEMDTTLYLSYCPFCGAKIVLEGY